MEKVERDGYLILENGTIISPRGKEIVPSYNGKGYKICRIKLDGVWKTRTLHSIICETFHGKRPDGLEVGHIDGDKLNNHKDNLRWLSKSENNHQAYQDGRDVKGIKNANNKLSESIVHTICKELESNTNLNVSKLAKELGVNRATINAIKHKRQWLIISQLYNF